MNEGLSRIHYSINVPNTTGYLSVGLVNQGGRLSIYSQRIQGTMLDQISRVAEHAEGLHAVQMSPTKEG